MTTIDYADTADTITNFPEDLYQLLIVSVAISVLQERMNDYLYEQEDAELVQLQQVQINTLLQEQQKLMVTAGLIPGGKNVT